MKKINLIALGLAAGLTVSAQSDVVKNVEGLVKSKKFKEAVEAVQPALNNPETSGTAAPWFLAGEASVGMWDALMLANVAGQASNDQIKSGSRALVDAYNYFVKALPLDELPDAKGKVKPKYTKKIKKTIGENYHNYMNAGLNLYNVQDYPGAYEAWDLYVNLPNNPNADQGAFKADPDSVVAQIAYYQGLAAYFSDNTEGALRQLDKALNAGYKDKTAYLLGVEAANKLNDADRAYNYAVEGNKYYGADDISFLAQIINTNLEKEKYAECLSAIASSRDNAANDSIKSMLYNVEAIVYERENKVDDAKNAIKKSIELNPANAKSYFDYGRLLQNEVAGKEDNADEATRKNVLAPTLLEAVKNYERSYELDDSQSNLPGYIYRIYYSLDQNYHMGPEYAEKAEYWKNM